MDELRDLFEEYEHKFRDNYKEQKGNDLDLRKVKSMVSRKSVPSPKRIQNEKKLKLILESKRELKHKEKNSTRNIREIVESSEANKNFVMNIDVEKELEKENSDGGKNNRIEDYNDEIITKDMLSNRKTEIVPSNSYMKPIPIKERKTTDISPTFYIRPNQSILLEMNKHRRLPTANFEKLARSKETNNYTETKWKTFLKKFYDRFSAYVKVNFIEPKKIFAQNFVNEQELLLKFQEIGFPITLQEVQLLFKEFNGKIKGENLQRQIKYWKVYSTPKDSEKTEKGSPKARSPTTVKSKRIIQKPKISSVPHERSGEREQKYSNISIVKRNNMHYQPEKTHSCLIKHNKTMESSEIQKELADIKSLLHWTNGKKQSLTGNSLVDPSLREVKEVERIRNTFYKKFSRFVIANGIEINDIFHTLQFISERNLKSTMQKLNFPDFPELHEVLKKFDGWIPMNEFCTKLSCWKQAKQIRNRTPGRNLSTIFRRGRQITPVKLHTRASIVCLDRSKMSEIEFINLLNKKVLEACSVSRSLNKDLTFRTKKHGNEYFVYMARSRSKATPIPLPVDVFEQEFNKLINLKKYIKSISPRERKFDTASSPRVAAYVGPELEGKWRQKEYLGITRGTRQLWLNLRAQIDLFKANKKNTVCSSKLTPS